MVQERITEQPSPYRHLEQLPVAEIVQLINQEDRTVAIAVGKVLPQITRLVTALAAKMQAGGRLFYLGAGTSGRLGCTGCQ